MKKTKILWVSASIPSKKIPHAGGQTFRYYFNNIIDDNRFDVKLIAMNDNLSKDVIDHELDGKDYKIVYRANKLRARIKKIWNIGSKFNPWTKYAGLIYNTYAKEILNDVREYKEAGFVPHIVILEWTAMVVLAGDIKEIFPHCRIVASEHDVTFIGMRRIGEYYKGIKGLLGKIRYLHEKEVELDSLRLCDLVLPHNPGNMEILKNEGVNENKLQWLAPYFNNMSECGRFSNYKDILFFGAMSRPENYLSAIWFIDNVMPLIEDLDIRFVVLGSNPPQELKGCESDKVHIMGFVDSIEPYFEQSMCLVAPLVLGAGIKVKILEALSSGIPVLTNQIGIEGIPASAGTEYIHCERPEDYGKMIRSICNGVIDVREIEKKAKLFISRYDLETSAEQYKQNLLKLVGKGNR